jgi:hypothetical protein
VVGGDAGREGSRALLRGHRRALADLWVGPRAAAVPGEIKAPTGSGGPPAG